MKFFLWSKMTSQQLHSLVYSFFRRAIYFCIFAHFSKRSLCFVFLACSTAHVCCHFSFRFWFLILWYYIFCSSSFNPQIARVQFDERKRSSSLVERGSFSRLFRSEHSTLSGNSSNLRWTSLDRTNYSTLQLVLITLSIHMREATGGSSIVGVTKRFLGDCQVHAKTMPRKSKKKKTVRDDLCKLHSTPNNKFTVAWKMRHKSSLSLH